MFGTTSPEYGSEYGGLWTGIYFLLRKKLMDEFSDLPMDKSADPQWTHLMKSESISSQVNSGSNKTAGEWQK